jgi:AraC-like DNA-binding protein
MSKNDTSSGLSGRKDEVFFVNRTSFGVDTLLIEQTREAGYLTRTVERHQPCTESIVGFSGCLCACFLFDYPAIADLVELTEAKQAWHRIPFFLVTVQHSEEFAIWAFRNKIYDFFPQPVDTDRFFHLLAELRAVLRSPRETRHPTQACPRQLPTDARVSPARSAQRKMRTAVAYLERHYPDKIMQKSIAESCGMSTFQFSREFHAEFGVSFQDYLRRLRIQKAAVLLRNPEASVIDIAFATGFHDPSYFSRAFKQLIGILPSEYKVRYQKIAINDTGDTGTATQIQEQAIRRSPVQTLASPDVLVGPGTPWV